MFDFGISERPIRQTIRIDARCSEGLGYHNRSSDFSLGWGILVSTEEG